MTGEAPFGLGGQLGPPLPETYPLQLDYMEVSLPRLDLNENQPCFLPSPMLGFPEAMPPGPLPVGGEMGLGSGFGCSSAGLDDDNSPVPGLLGLYATLVFEELGLDGGLI